MVGSSGGFELGVQVCKVVGGVSECSGVGCCGGKHAADLADGASLVRPLDEDEEAKQSLACGVQVRHQLLLSVRIRCRGTIGTTSKR